MQHIGIETAQNVVVEQEVANLGSRIIAYILDTLVQLAWVIFCAIFGFIFADLFDNMAVLWTFVTLAALPYMLYHLICEITMDGQSIGKRSQGIKVATLDGSQPRIGQYLLRWVLRPVDGFYWLGLMVILINGKGQRLGDLAAGTAVVSMKPRIRLEETLVAKVKPDHTVRFPQAAQLTDGQVALIHEVLNNTEVKDIARVIQEMAEKVEGLLGITREGLTPVEFLNAVLADHVYLAGDQGSSFNR